MYILKNRGFYTVNLGKIKFFQNLILISYYIIFNYFIFNHFLAIYLSLVNILRVLPRNLMTNKFEFLKKLSYITNMDTNFVYLSELILNIYIIFHSGPPFGKYRGFSVVHGNNLKVTIFSERRLGMKNNIYSLLSLI